MWKMSDHVPDEILATIVPILVYWVYAGIHYLLEPIQKYRLHSKAEENEKNLVAKSTVIKSVLLQQIMQAIIAIVVYKATRGSTYKVKIEEKTSLTTIALQIIVGMIVLDTCQYFVHRYLHHNKYLYQHVHSVHHKLLVPYAYGAFYNHPVEGLLDIIGGALAHWVSGMTPTTSMFFFSFVTIKAMDDHSGLWLPVFAGGDLVINMHGGIRVFILVASQLVRAVLVTTILDIMSGAMTNWIFGMSPITSMFFFSLVTVRAMDDYSGLWLPANPLQLQFANNSAYRDVDKMLRIEMQYMGQNAQD